MQTAKIISKNICKKINKEKFLHHEKKIFSVDFKPPKIKNIGENNIKNFIKTYLPPKQTAKEKEEKYINNDIKASTV